MPWLGLAPFLFAGSLSRVMLLFLPLLVKFLGREGTQCSLQGLGKEMEREIAAVSSNPAGKAGRGLKWQVRCLH